MAGRLRTLVLGARRGYLRIMLAPTDVLSREISALVPAWLVLRCECQYLVMVPLRLLASRYGGNLRLGDVVPRLRCEKCSNAPASIRLNETPYRNASGMAMTNAAALGWSVDLTHAVRK